MATAWHSSAPVGQMECLRSVESARGHFRRDAFYKNRVIRTGHKMPELVTDRCRGIEIRRLRLARVGALIMTRLQKLNSVIVAAAIASACAAQAPDAAQPQHTGRSILASSSPAAGSTVAGTADTLELHFNPPARLDEVALVGPGGTMPMMVHAVGEAAHYSLPLSGVTPGAYTVNWRATAQGSEHRGNFSFTVR